MAARLLTSRRRQGEPTLPLINIVFLMLIFFLAAAQLARPLDPELQLIDTSDPNIVPPPDAVVLRADGQVEFRGEVRAPTEIWSALSQETGNPETVVRVVPDRRSAARDLIVLANALREAGAGAVHIVTEKALQ